MDHPPPLHHRVVGPPAAWHGLAAAVQAWCDAQALPEDEGPRLNLLIEELLANTWSHGYRGDAAQAWVDLELARVGDELHLTLSDGAPRFDPTARALPALPVDAGALAGPPGGLGLAFVRRLVRRWEHAPLPAGNRLKLVRGIGDAPL